MANKVLKASFRMISFLVRMLPGVKFLYKSELRLSSWCAKKLVRSNCVLSSVYFAFCSDDNALKYLYDIKQKPLASLELMIICLSKLSTAASAERYFSINTELCPNALFRWINSMSAKFVLLYSRPPKGS